MQDLVLIDGVIEWAVEKARLNSEADLRPQQEALTLNRNGLLSTQQEIDALVATITSGGATSALLTFLNQRANELKLQKEQLLTEQRALLQSLAPLQRKFDSGRFRTALKRVSDLSAVATPVLCKIPAQLAGTCVGPWRSGYTGGVAAFAASHGA